MKPLPIDPVLAASQQCGWVSSVTGATYRCHLPSGHGADDGQDAHDFYRCIGDPCPWGTCPSPPIEPAPARGAEESSEPVPVPPAGAGAPPPGTRLILASDTLLDKWGSRTEDGYAIRADWGKPDENGWYTPTFTIDYTNQMHLNEDWGDDLRRLFDEITALRMQRRRLLDRIHRLESDR